MRKRVILHVGLHKTGTTYLQERVFPALPGVRFVHPLHVEQPEGGPIEQFLFSVFFRNAAGIDLDSHRERVDAWLAQIPEPTVLISSEAIVGWPVENHSNFKTNVDMLAELLPDAKLWLVVRRQDHWVESAYAQLLKAGFSTSVERYLNYRDGQFRRYNIGLYNGPNLDARDLDWGIFDSYLRRRWGEQAVLTTPFEWFVRDVEAYLRRFYAFAGIDAELFPDNERRVNERWSPAASQLAKLVNRVPMPVKRAMRDVLGAQRHPSTVLTNTLGRWLPQSRTRHLSPELAAALLRLHGDNNRRLADRCGADLGAYGYFDD